MYKVRKIIIAVIFLCIYIDFCNVYCFAAENTSDIQNYEKCDWQEKNILLTANTETSDEQSNEEKEIEKLLDQYGTKDIDADIKKNGYTGSFSQLLKEIMGEGTGSSKVKNNNLTGKIFKGLDKTLFETFSGNKTAIVQIIILAVLSAVIRFFGADRKNSQVSDITQIMISVALIGILLASFTSAAAICTDAVTMCLGIYKSVIPMFFSLVSMISGSVTAAAYYEVILILITAVNIVFQKVLIVLNKMYLLIVLADSIAKEERFSKAAEIIPVIIKWSCKGIIIFFTGLGGIKSMIAPLSDSVKKNLIYKAMEVIPGVGSAAASVSQTILGAGSIIRNGVGSAAIIILISVCAIPVLKLTVLACLFKVTGAALEPVADKRVVKMVNCTSTAVGSFALMILTVLSLLVLMIAIICIVSKQ